MRFTIRIENHDGTFQFDHPESENLAHGAFLRIRRASRTSIKAIQLRRHEDDGTITIIREEEGRWQQ